MTDVELKVTVIVEYAQHLSIRHDIIKSQENYEDISKM